MVETYSSKAFSCRKAAQFFIAIIITLIIGKIVVNIPLFSNTELFRALTLAELVSFVTQMAVLVFVFIFTKHVINALEGTGSGVSFLRGIAVPVASLIIAVVAQESVREILNPFLGATGNTLLILLSSLIVFVTALWVILAGYQHSPLLFDFFVSAGKAVRSRIAGNPVGRTCFNCDYPIDNLVKYCPACGIELETGRCKNCNSALNPSAKYCGQCGHIREGQG